MGVYSGIGLFSRNSRKNMECGEKNAFFSDILGGFGEIVIIYTHG